MTCYMCDKPASTKEHVPPKCLFPEKKDIGEDKYKKDLITVPSCPEHNTMKSDDDEFLMVSLAGMMGNNSIGYIHANTKVTRAINRSSNRLLEEAFLTRKSINIEAEENEFIKVIVGTPDVPRLENSFKHIAYGIYYHHFQERFEGDIKMIMGFLHSEAKNHEVFINLIKHKFELEGKEKETFGKNQDVFYYQFLEADENNIIGLKICFYSGVEVYISFISNDAKKPFDLSMALMNYGIKTIINLDGKTYEFN
ncbi:hypothetical protein [Sulfurimonas sp. RIFOXYB12_FULL_35_9]|uniref:hypothetical protein n=1 Tax=Sulfurimonas sp. RIFOXYB12_FULL_35_9 TaxID=1802256 RepID=UPI0008C44C45|nr:hypothetical protein [Sulfurimonas sp. RIFOXYB12_FULL_35_9]OHE03676.1 MAG: hypothetical protein A2345_04825 [Sulfurimonas sp. RIFOXYB12_FULL_35_9]